MDKDLASLQAMRDAVEAAHEAQRRFSTYDQAQVDRICEAMVDAGWRNSRYLAELAVEETGMGRADSKHMKNFVGLRLAWDDIKDLATCGVIRYDEERRVHELATPYGVVAAIVPTTNPTSTAMFKILIALKTRNAIVISPHPRAIRCTSESARILDEAATAAGAPPGLIQCLTQVTLQSTQALMTHPKTDLILATGGSALVTESYSSGKPAYGVGPGNVPVLIDPSADLAHAVACVVTSQTFDNGTICSSEQSVICERRIADDVLAMFRAHKAHVASPAECQALARVVTRGKTMNPAVVGKFPHEIAALAGFEVPQDTTVLICPTEGVGFSHPLSFEILAPILSFYAEPDAAACKARALEVLHFEGLGHSFGIHAQDEGVIWDYAAEMPVYRVHVNAPTTQASVGFAVKLEPSMTLGCGPPGGNISGDNITARHLMCIKRVGWLDPAFDQEYITPRIKSAGGSAGARIEPTGPASGSFNSGAIRGDSRIQPGGNDGRNIIQVPSRPYLMSKYNKPE